MRKSLTKTFLDNSVARFVFRHSEKISSGGLVLSNGILIFKNGFEPNLEGACGVLFLAASASLRLSKTHPDLAFRLTGACTIAGALLLSASGIDFDRQQIADAYKFVAPFGYILPSLLVVFQKEVAALAEKGAHSKNTLTRSFAQACRYPVIAGTILQAAGMAGMVKSAVDHGSLLGWAAIYLCSAIGTFGTFASDPRAQEAFREEAKLPEFPSSTPSPHPPRFLPKSASTP